VFGEDRAGRQAAELAYETAQRNRSGGRDVEAEAEVAERLVGVQPADGGGDGGGGGGGGVRCSIVQV
jgi:hypothetical protein